MYVKKSKKVEMSLKNPFLKKVINFQKACHLLT